MKNIFKMLGIIAVLAMIVTVVGCATDPEDQVTITVQGIPSGANNQYAYYVLFNSKSGGVKILAQSDSSSLISNKTSTTYMLDAKGGLFGTPGTYHVGIYISKNTITTTEDLDEALFFYTPSPVGIIKGPNIFDTSRFKTAASLTMEEIFGDEDVSEDAINLAVGTFKFISNNNTEIIIIADNSFKISDSSGSLEFNITDWEYAATPGKYIDDYPNALKFKGAITKANPDSGPNSYIGSFSQTGRGITPDDIKANGSGTVCWMYLYISDDGKFVRTPFTKTGAAKENKDVVLTTSTSGVPRVYVKQ